MLFPGEPVSSFLSFINFPGPEAGPCRIVQTDAFSAEMLKPWNIQVFEVTALDLVLCTSSKLLITWFLTGLFFFFLQWLSRLLICRSLHSWVLDLAWEGFRVYL